MMPDTILSQAWAVDADHHDHHHHHIGDVGDGGDDTSLLLQSPEEGIPGDATITPDDDPIAVIEAALIRLKDDVGVLAEEDVVCAFSILQATDMPAFLRFRHAAKLANRDCSITVLDKLVRDELPGGGDDPSILDELVALARAQCQLHHDADRKAVAVIPSPGRQEVWRVYSTGFEEWLRSAYWRAKETGVPESTMKSALATIAAAGINDGKQIDIHVRAARDESGYLIDLCDEQWRAVRVTTHGWQVLDHSPVHFTRTQSMRALPEPERGGDIGLLWQHTNIPGNRRMMVLTWLLDSFRPDTPFPVLELVGEQGSAKSTTQSVLRSLVDPNKVMLRGRPKTVEDIFVAAANNWLVSYENLSGLTAEQQDAFCTLSTGGGFASRQLYTNGEEHIMETKRPVVLNGIAVVATRPDLIDRVIHVDMPTIPPEARKDDADTSTAWDRDRPMVFGALLDLFADALRILPSVTLTHKQRMADFERFGEAVARALGFQPGDFQRQYAELVRAGIDRALESNAVAQVLDKYFEERISPWNWQGTAGQLYDLLNNQIIPDRSTWPKPFSKQMLYKLLHNRVYRGEIPHKGQFYPGAHAVIIDQGLWDAAHAILAQNNRQRTSETWQRRQPEALLFGLFYTADGEKYQPAFTKKPNGKRYRYYVPNRKVRFGADASPAGRVPAEPIEQMVLAQIHAALMSPEMVQSVWDVTRGKYPALTEPEVVLPLRQMGQVWAQLFPAERQRIVQLLVDRVTLREEGIEITWRDTGWHTLAGEMRAGTIGAELLELEQQEALA